LAKERVDVERLVRLSVSALLRLLDEFDDRCESHGERLFVGQFRARRRWDEKHDRRDGDRGETDEATRTYPQAVAFDAAG
jgi:hypothetical protein